MNSSANPGSSHVTVKNLAFALVTFVFVLIAHAVAYLTHEYSHSLTAWSLGWMKQPFGIDYGPATAYNIIFLGDVSDNVDYSPILASGNGHSAALIALAGPFMGNGLLYFILYGLTSTSFIKSRRFVLALFLLAIPDVRGQCLGLCPHTGDYHARRYRHRGARPGYLHLGIISICNARFGLHYLPLLLQNVSEGLPGCCW